MKFDYKDILIIILALAVTLLFVKVLRLEEKPVQTEAPATAEEIKEEEEHEGEIAPEMSKLQIFMDKMWFAGQGDNWELASFYAHEMEEAIEALEEMNAEEEGQDINELLEKMYEPAFEEMESAIKQQDKSAFESNYEILLNSCNACHAVVKHAFIKIQVPTSPVFSNQDYNK